MASKAADRPDGAWSCQACREVTCGPGVVVGERLAGPPKWLREGEGPTWRSVNGTNWIDPGPWNTGARCSTEDGPELREAQGVSAPHLSGPERQMARGADGPAHESADSLHPPETACGGLLLPSCLAYSYCLLSMGRRVSTIKEEAREGASLYQVDQ